MIHCACLVNFQCGWWTLKHLKANWYSAMTCSGQEQYKNYLCLPTVYLQKCNCKSNLTWESSMCIWAKTEICLFVHLYIIIHNIIIILSLIYSLSLSLFLEKKKKQLHNLAHWVLPHVHVTCTGQSNIMLRLWCPAFKGLRQVISFVWWIYGLLYTEKGLMLFL